MDYRVILKEKYQAPVDGQSVYIGQAVIVEDSGRRFLVLKLANKSAKTVTAVQVQIIEQDARGQEYSRRLESIQSLCVAPGMDCVLEQRIALSNRCERFVVLFEGAEEGLLSKQPERKFSVKPRRRTVSALIAIVGFILIGLVFGLSLVELGQYRETTDGFRLLGVDYVFENGDKSSTSPIVVTGYVGTKSEIELPSAVEGHPVVAIEANAFRGNKTIEKVIVRGGSSIGAGAFADCPKLKVVEIDSVIELVGGLEILRGSKNIEVLRVGGLPSGVSIPQLFGLDFGEELALAELSIGSIEEIGENFCYGLSKLESVTVDNLNSSEVGAGAFFGCSRLAKWNLPKKLTAVGANAFAGTAVKTFDASEIERLGKGAFANCKSLISFDLAENDVLTEIADASFLGCSALVQIPLSVDSKLVAIGDSAFSGCSALTDLPVMSSLQRIGTEAFAGCYSIRTATLPRNILSVGRGAFKACKSLRELTMPFVGGGAQENAFFAYLFGATKPEETGVVPDSLLRVRLTDTVEIGNRAFFGLDRLEEIEIPQTLNKIGTGAFDGCYRLFEVLNLSALKISRGNTANGKVGYYALKVYTSLEEARSERVETDGFKWIQASDGKWFLTGYDETQTVLHLPEGFMHGGVAVEQYEIPIRLFQGNQKIIEAVVPDSVNQIGVGAFFGCNLIQRLTIPYVGGSINSNGYFGYIFGAPSAKSPEAVPSSLKSVVLSGGRKISANAFYGLGALVRIELPSTLTEIGTDAFYKCVNLYEVYNPSNLSIVKGSKAFGAVAYYAVAVFKSTGLVLERTVIDGIVFLHSGSDWAVVGYEGNASDLTLSEFMFEGKMISDYAVKRAAFANCETLERLTIGGAVSWIEENAFSDCVNLKQVMMSDGLLRIGDGAFRSCENLLSIQIPRSVEEIGDNAFYHCRQLYDVVNLSKLSVRKGTLDFGYLGYYALRVSQNASAEEMVFARGGDCEFLRLDGEWYLYAAHDGLDLLILPETFGYGGGMISSYTVLENAFYQVYSGSVMIPNSARKILRGNDSVFFDLGSAYYGGNQERWSALMSSLANNSPLRKNPVYFFVECVHESGQWSFVSGGISTVVNKFERVVLKEATCQKTGVGSIICKRCGISNEETLPVVDHKFDGKGNCTTCGRRWTTAVAENFDKLFENDKKNPFAIDENGVITSTNHANLSTSVLTFRAKGAVVIKFDYFTSSERNCDKLEIRKNGILIAEVSGETIKEMLEIELKAGDVLTISYAKDKSSASGKDCIFLQNFAIFS